MNLSCSESDWKSCYIMIIPYLCSINRTNKTWILTNCQAGKIFTLTIKYVLRIPSDDKLHDKMVLCTTITAKKLPGTMNGKVCTWLWEAN